MRGAFAASEAAPLVIDRRSHNQPHDINAVMEREGFRLERVALGTFDEWTGYYGRA
jgi:hypothetical protein